ncbi:helix-turn-helix domain-containing protein [Virgibacillus sp. W0430]|uniref:helix-turn-helix domain-containing protein n=1 Tax=Virgibacillus sp. W0430 TaxID=3391580 RepID=UPI003F45B42D
MNYLHDYSTFESVEELNESINDHIQRNQYELNETDRNIFLMIGRYSVKYKGAAHLKADTIAEAIDRTTRTVQRSIRKLERLDMIERKEFIREKSGGHGANIYIVLSSNVSAEMSEREQVEEPTQASDEGAEDRFETIYSLSNNSSNTYDTHTDRIENERLINESIRNNTPAEIVDMLTPFFYGSELYKYVGIVFKAKYRPHANIRIESHLKAFKACIFDVIRRYKDGHIRNLEAYLYASIRRLSRRLFLDNVART